MGRWARPGLAMRAGVRGRQWKEMETRHDRPGLQSRHGHGSQPRPARTAKPCDARCGGSKDSKHDISQIDSPCSQECFLCLHAGSLAKRLRARLLGRLRPAYRRALGPCRLQLPPRAPRRAAVPLGRSRPCWSSAGAARRSARAAAAPLRRDATPSETGRAGPGDRRVSRGDQRSGVRSRPFQRRSKEQEQTHATSSTTPLPTPRAHPPEAPQHTGDQGRAGPAKCNVAGHVIITFGPSMWDPFQQGRDSSPPRDC